MIHLFTFVAKEETAIRFSQTKLADKESTVVYEFFEPVNMFEVSAYLTEKDYLSFRPRLETFWRRA